jgi:hypothetical protein
MLLKYGRIDEDQSGALRLVNYVLTGGQLFRWKRAEVGPADEVKARMLDTISSVLDRGSWDLLERLFPSTRPPHYEGPASRGVHTTWLFRRRPGCLTIVPGDFPDSEAPIPSGREGGHDTCGARVANSVSRRAKAQSA